MSLDFEWQGEKYAVELAPHDSRVIVKESEGELWGQKNVRNASWL